MYNVTVLSTLLTFCIGSLQVVRVTEEFLAFYTPMAAMWCQFTVACDVILGRTNLCTVCTVFSLIRKVVVLLVYLLQGRLSAKTGR